MAIINVDVLAGTGGYRIVDTGYEVSPGLRNGFLSLSVGRPTLLGDVNGDGLRDILWADEFAPFDPFGQSGRAFVVFGQAGASLPNFELESLNGSNGFFINPTGGLGFLGSAAAGGDVNGDGLGDIIVSIPNPSSTRAPHHLVIFGKTGAFPLNVTADMLDGANGFVITGAGGGDQIGAGDFNDDGFSDIVVGSAGTNSAYVVFGKSAGFPATFDISSLNGANGFTLTNFGSNAVANAGDMNGDGIDDLVVANPFVGGTGGAFVVYGRASFSPTVNLMFLDPSIGVYLNGESSNDRTGESVSSAGDVNGDGYDDLILGAIQFAVPAGPTGPGKAYVVFGGPSLGSSLELSELDGTNGFAIVGETLGDLFGIQVASAGDFNGDGFDDIIVASGNSASPAYLIYGRAGGFPSVFDASSINDQTGLLFDQGGAVSGGGDVNGDGLDDLLLTGSTTSSPGLIFGSQSALFVIHGFALPRNLVGGDLADTLSGAALGDSLSGLNGSDLITGRAGDDTIDGGAGNDTIDGGDDNDLILAQSGRDSVLGGAGNDSIDAAAGDDTVDGGANNDQIFGGTGFDLISGGNGNDTMQGATENDTLSGGKGFDYLLGQDGNDSLVGDDLADTLVGGNGSDFLNGGIDNDRLLGDAQHDTIFGDAGDDVIDAGTGNDTVDGGGQRDSVFGGSGFDSVDGGAGNDTLTGGADGDTLLGGAGFDILQGDAGDDVLNGGASNDVIFGNAGNDTIIFEIGGGTDTLRDFTAGAASEDVINLVGFGAAFDSFGEIIAAATQTGNHVTIDFGGGDVLIIRNTLVSALHADDFTFG